VVWLVSDLPSREAKAGETGGDMCLVAQAIPCLLGGGTVVAQTVGLDDQAQFRPVEIHPEAVHVLLSARLWESGLAGDW
jgi:hypothetical protein